MAEEGPLQAPTSPTRRRGEFGVNVLKLSSGAVIAQGITIVTLPILSRLFLPDAYGAWQVFTAVVLILSTVVCLRYDMAIVLPSEDEEAANVFGLCVGVGVALSALTGVVLLLAGAPIVRVLNAPTLLPYLWLIPVALVIHGLWRAASAWCTRTKRFGRQSLAQVAGSATTSAVPITVAALGHSGAGVLVATWVLGWVANTGVLVGQVWRDAWGLFRRSIRWATVVECLKRYRKFPLVDTWGTLFNAISWQMAPLLLAAFFSESVAGYYSPANRLVVLPLSLLGNAIVPVFLQRASEVRTKPQELSRMAALLFRRLVAVGLFPAVLLVVAGKDLVLLFLGPNWNESGTYLQILSPWMFFLFVSIPLSVMFTVLERQEFSLVTQTLILVTRLGALVVGGLLHSVYLALALWTVTGVLVYGGMAVWSLVLAGIRISATVWVLVEYGLYSLPAALLLLALKYWLGASAWWVCAAVAVLLGLYALWVLRRDRALAQYLRALIPALLRRGGTA